MCLYFCVCALTVKKIEAVDLIDSKGEGTECGEGWTEKRKRRKQCDYILISKKSKYIFF